MPMPTPKKNEEKREFVSRCIAKLSKDESDKFPTSKQRAAIRYSEWGETPAEKKVAMAKSGTKKSGGGRAKSK